MVKVAIFDYGAGNIFSLKNSFENAGASVDVITNFDKPNEYSGLLLPGVGNFDPAIKSITQSSQTGFKNFVKDVTPVLGICLGMEMFFEKSEEGKEKGLGIIDGEVIVLPNTMKVPHMGWNQIKIRRKSKLFKDIEDGSWVYFVHSYKLNLDLDIIDTTSSYGDEFGSSISFENVYATQFHPEKSSDLGLNILKNFCKI